MAFANEHGENIANFKIQARTKSRLDPALKNGACAALSVNVATVQRVAGILAATPARFVDGAIIGAPPRPGTPGPTFYLAGEPAADLGCLQALGLQTRTLDGAVGAASALNGLLDSFLGLAAPGDEDSR